MVAKVTNEEKGQTMQNTVTDGNESTVQDTIAALKGIPTEEALTQMLKEQVLKVTFLKLDGDQRIMTCTKSMDYIPERSRPNNTSKPSKPGTINVWDIDADNWRSFRYDRVQTVEPNITNIQEVG
jgi:hypothetical protein